MASQTLDQHLPVPVASHEHAADVARAAEFQDREPLEVCGRWSDPDRLEFDLARVDGTCERFTGAELKRANWVHFLPPQLALAIELALSPARSEVEVRFVARADRSAGGKLIRGSRLSGFFTGEADRDAAYDERDRLRSHWPDAAVFQAASVEAAERLCAASAAEDEGMRIRLEQLSAARGSRRGALAGSPS